MDFTINHLSNGDFTVTTKERTMIKTGTPKSFILLSPLAPSFFGYDDGEVARMVEELEDLGITTLMVDTGKELMLYARCSCKDTLEKLCTVYDIGGILVESNAIYDQVSIPEVV